MYRLPWNATNNPDAWIEPTTFCNFTCPGCYRGLAEPNPERIHIPLDEMKKEVDMHIEKRNIQTISIAGGEPLMYPDLDKLVEYIHEKGLKTKIFTNGAMLNEDRLEHFKSKGATEFVVHVEREQRKLADEDAVDNERLKFVELFRKVGGVNLGFIMPIAKDDRVALEHAIAFCKEHADIINLLVFTTFKEMLPGKSLPEHLRWDMEGISKAVKEIYGLEYCAFLPKTHTDAVSWLFSVNAFCDKKLVGSFDGDAYKKLQARYYKKKGKYFITIKNYPTNAMKLSLLLPNKSIANILKGIGAKVKTDVYHQVVLLIDAPEKTDKGWDLCNGCPDAMYWDGKLVPSCLVERIKAGEDITVPSHSTHNEN